MSHRASPASVVVFLASAIAIFAFVSGLYSLPLVLTTTDSPTAISEIIPRSVSWGVVILVAAAFQACLFVLARFLSLTISRRMKVPGPVLFFVLLFLVGLSVAVLIEMGDTLWQDRWTDKQVYFVGAIWVVSLVTVLAGMLQAINRTIGG